MAEADVRGAQHPLAQGAAVGEHQREGRVVADRADVAEVIGDALQLGHHGPQPDRTRRNVDAECGLHGSCKGNRVCHCAVAGNAPSQLGRALDRRAHHERLGAFVDVAQSLLKPDDGFAVGREAEMSRLDDARVHGADRDLMHRRAFSWQKRVVDALGWRA